MRLGYSFWGFLGAGVVDTPDGGRSHRRTMVDALRAAGHDIVFLQPNRDLQEAGLDLRHSYEWDEGFPRIDALFLEWRWPIPGRNTTPCGTFGHTCDLHRQRQLLEHYAVAGNIRTLLWDKDLQLAPTDPVRHLPEVTVCEPALHPSPGARTLLFPVSDEALRSADARRLAARPRKIPLVYIGNQYDRDDAFDRFFAPAAAQLQHRVAGKWTATEAWPHVTFTGRCAFGDVEPLYGSSLATVLLLPERYARVGQMTQRIFEAVLAGCLPLLPATVRDPEVFVPARLIVRAAGDVIAAVGRVKRIAGSPEHVELIEACLQHLEMFRVSRQIVTVQEVFEDLRTASLRRQP